MGKHPKDYALNLAGVQILHFITAGTDPKVNERGQRAAEAGALSKSIKLMKVFPKPEKPAKKASGKADVHLADHCVAGIRNITACSDELARQARELGPNQACVAER